MSPITGVMNGVVSAGCCLDGLEGNLLDSVDGFDAVLPDGGREREVRMESPMFGGREAVNNNNKKMDRLKH